MGQAKYLTKTVKDKDSPTWDETFEVLVVFLVVLLVVLVLVVHVNEDDDVFVVIIVVIVIVIVIGNSGLLHFPPLLPSFSPFPSS